MKSRRVSPPAPCPLLPRGALRLGAAWVLVAFCAALILAGCCAAATAAPIRARDARGREIVLSSAPRRIVSIAPSNTEILFALGLGSRVVGVTDFCDYPPAARTKPRVGGVVLNYEKIVSLKPDLVIAKYDLQKANIARLEEMNRYPVRVFAVNPHTVGETLDAIEAIGQVTGRTAQARAIVADMKRELALARRIGARDRHRPRVLAVVQRKPLIVVGPRTFMDDALRIAGAENVAGDALQPYPQFSLEAAVARKPEVMLLSFGAPAEFYADPAWRSTPAVRAHRIYAPKFLPILERPGPRLAGAVLDLARLLHPPGLGRR